MSAFNKNMSIKIMGAGIHRWGACKVKVAPRAYNALVYRHRGNGTLTGDNFSVKSNEGDVFFMPNDTPYFADYHSANEIFYIHFYSDIKSMPENFQKVPDAKNLFEKLISVWDKKETGYYINSLSIFCDIIKAVSIPTSSSTTKSEDLFEKAFMYIRENLKKPDLSIDRVISASGISGTYFRRLFTEKTGCSPKEYITSERLKIAEQLLLSGEYSISEAAAMSGFSDSNYFARVVKKEYGVSPSKLYKHK